MAGPDSSIVQHYTRPGLFDRIMEGLAASGKNPEALAPEDLKPVDEFHIGGIEATEALLAQLDIPPGARVLDIGAGIGGTARYLAARYRAEVTGVDLTPEFVETARRLTGLVGLEADFRVGSALDLPFEDGRFDLATLIHVGMNLPDKPGLFAEAARALRPGGTFAIYDVMQTDAEHPAFPLPWAAGPEASFLAPPETYLEAAKASGLALTARRERADFARDFFAKLAAAFAGGPPPPLGLGLIMGSDAPMKIRNMVAAVNAGHVAPVEMIFRKPG